MQLIDTNPIEQVEQALVAVRKDLLEHPLYSKIKTIEDLRIFMEHHIWAVWDFMSLLKSLQYQLTCTEVPWRPKGSPSVRRFINEIVLGEESDEDKDGNAASHFELYIDAMEKANADTSVMNHWVEALEKGISIEALLASSKLPKTVYNFVRFTFDIIQKGQPHLVAAAFTWGREDLIPDMFTQMIKDIQSNLEGSSLEEFIYYFERHIELDGDEHGPLARKMMQELCGNDEQKWEECIQISEQALLLRKGLWDGILSDIENKK